jgi:hypothetical protein
LVLVQLLYIGEKKVAVIGYVCVYRFAEEQCRFSIQE